MQLYIPQLSDKLKLTNPWTFTLHWEARNRTLVEACLMPYLTKNKGPAKNSDLWYMEGLTYKGTSIKTTNEEITLPAGSILSVDRIYIRQGVKDFNSVTFRLIKSSASTIIISDGSVLAINPKVRSIRFWAKLADANRIEFIPYV